MEFRSDINGLRAWAVIAVVLFHFNISGFSGGFVGVDIFFVISGFLMTQIIATGLRNNNFSYWFFLKARIRRIVPALMVLCAVTMLFGWYVLDDTGYRVLMRHVGTSLLFVSNFKYWREAGYFDDASHEKLLLHTWSLSTEWQFYMLLPLLMMLVWKIFKKDRPVIVAIIFTFIVSLGCSIYFSAKDPGGAFFLLHTRAWEMLAGGLVFYFSDYFKKSFVNRKLFEWLGFAFILVSIFWLKPADVWPGYLALMPVVGTSLVLLANGQGYWVNNKIAQWIGNSSYSIYLWHWPLAAILNYSENVTLPIQLVFVGISLLLGYLSYKFLEIPGKNAFLNKKNFGWYFIFAFLGLIALGAYTYENSRVSWRIPAAAREIYAESGNVNPGQYKCLANMHEPDPGCKYGGEKIGVILIGDSHAQSVVTALEKALPNKDLHVREWALPACATIFGLKPATGSDPFCPVEKLFEASKQYPADVPMVVVNRLAYNFEGQNEKAHAEPNWYINTKFGADKDLFQKEIHKAVVDTVCAFAEYRQVYMMRPIPELKVDVRAVMGKARAIFGETRRVSVSYEEYLQRTNLVRKAQDEAVQKCGVKLLDPTPYLCSHGRCWGDVDGKPVYVDDDHLSLRGSDLLVPEFRKIFE